MAPAGRDRCVVDHLRCCLVGVLIMWESVKDLASILWGTGWGFYDGFGRYLILSVAALIASLIVGAIVSGHSSRKFIRSCYARGGHVHYSYRSVAGPVIIVGNVGVPTTSTVTTMEFAEGPEDECRECS